MLKKIAFFFAAMCFVNLGWATCAFESNVYTKCKSGYYLGDSFCNTCPSPIGFSASPTSASQNTGGVTDCYVPAGTYTDQSGTFIWSSACYYTL